MKIEEDHGNFVTDLTLPLEGTNVLIYEDVKADSDLIRYCCTELGAKVFTAQSYEKAGQILEEESIDIAFVNLLLKKISFPDTIPVVAMGKTEPLISLKIMQYASACYIPKPLSISAVMLGIQKATRTFLEKENFVSDAVNIANTLNEMKSRITALYKNKTNKVLFKDSVEGHCYNCVYSKKAEELQEDDEYEVVAYFSEKGAIYCKHKNDCKLKEYYEFSKVFCEDLSEKSPLDMLEKAYKENKAESFIDFVTTAADTYNDLLDLLYTKKREFCCSKCEKSITDLEFKKGDNIHVSTEELLAGVSVYCHEKKCPLDHFFEVFTRKIT